jgi:hypothetical protein
MAVEEKNGSAHAARRNGKVMLRMAVNTFLLLLRDICCLRTGDGNKPESRGNPLIGRGDCSLTILARFAVQKVGR